MAMTDCLPLAKLSIQQNKIRPPAVKQCSPQDEESLPIKIT
jgi:hypothetical protein